MLLEDWGCDTIPLDSYPTGVVDELLENAHLLLLAPRLDEGVREAFLGAMGECTLQGGDMPVIGLSTLVEDIPALRFLPVPRRLGSRRGLVLIPLSYHPERNTVQHSALRSTESRLDMGD